MTARESPPVPRRPGGRLAAAAAPASSFPLSLLLPVVLVAGMTAVAFAFGRRELLFPEYGALTAGILVWRLPPWTARPADIFVLPAAAALLAVGLNLSHLPFAVSWGAGLGLILCLLRISKSHMVPSISALLLPLLLQFTSLLYPLAVAGTSLVLFLIALAGKREAEKKAVPDEGGAAPAPRLPQPPVRLVGAYWTLATIVGLLAWYAGARYLAAPPILVALLEVMKTRADRGFTKLAGLAAASAIGVCSYALIPNWVLCGTAVFLCVALACRALGIALPPALALGLLPMLLRGDQQLDFLGATVGGALLMIGGTTVFYRAVNARRDGRAPVSATAAASRPSLDHAFTALPTEVP